MYLLLNIQKYSKLGLSAVSFENRKYDHFDIFYNKYIIMTHSVNWRALKCIYYIYGALESFGTLESFRFYRRHLVRWHPGNLLLFRTNIHEKAKSRTFVLELNIINIFRPCFLI